MPYWPPEHPLNTIEQMLREHGYVMDKGADHDGDMWVSFVSVRIASVPVGEEEKLIPMVEKWLEERNN